MDSWNVYFFDLQFVCVCGGFFLLSSGGSNDPPVGTKQGEESFIRSRSTSNQVVVFLNGVPREEKGLKAVGNSLLCLMGQSIQQTHQGEKPVESSMSRDEDGRPKAL